jgi:asparagine synthase (glutamine-hydrolysing)
MVVKNMCGICGTIGFAERAVLKAMCKVIRHRGPDDHGIYLNDKVGLGHQRLSIIDLAGGHQPMCNEDESIWIVYNGEIYNFMELRDTLMRKGHKFNTRCDTEVIIHAYEEYGYDFVAKLRGMFAFAIWDDNKKLLILVRDRLGIKPLYYTIVDHSLIFASEIKSILQYDRVPIKVDLTAIYNYLNLRYITDGSTMFVGIRKILPGHMLIYEKHKLKDIKYWDLSQAPVERNRTERYYTEKLLNLLKESVKLRLMSDVPLGAYLSGGVDSSSVVALMSLAQPTPVKTFSVGFGLGEGTDELEYAKFVADYFNTDHHEIIVKPDAIDVLPWIVWYLDEPVADPAIIPVYLMSHDAKKHVTVVLTGEGGDELFAGYIYYQRLVAHERRRRLVPKKLTHHFVRLHTKLEGRIPSYILEDKIDDFIRYTTVQWDDEKLYTADFVANIDQNILRKNIEPYFKTASNYIDQMLHCDIKTLLPDNYLIKIDRATMAYSIEARVPILDHKIVEFATTIPPRLKIRSQVGKYILRRAMKGIVPDKILARRKHGFGVQGIVWYHDALKTIAPNLLSKSSIKRRRYFKFKFIEKLLNRLEHPMEQDAQRIWNLVTIELWHRIYIDQPNLQKKVELKLDKLI